MLELIDGWQLADPEKETWKKAADQFRLPYWDWARKQSYTRDYGVPEICTAYTWSVIKPGTKDTYEDINNPLTGYLNPKKDEHGKNVPMGDPSMGQNAIKNNGPLPVSVSGLSNREAHGSSGVNVLELVDTVFFPASLSQSGSMESTTGSTVTKE